MAKRIGRDHTLAAELWASGIHEARLLAAMIDDPSQVTEEQMETWAAGFDSWDVVDGTCSSLFDKTPFAYAKAKEWSGREEEFVKRAGFVGKRNLTMNREAIALAQRIHRRGPRPARWVASDALRELQSESVMRRLEAGKAKR